MTNENVTWIFPFLSGYFTTFQWVWSVQNMALTSTLLFGCPIWMNGSPTGFKWHIYLLLATRLRINTYYKSDLLQIADISLVLACKPKYSKKQRFSSSFLLTWSKYTDQKWPPSTQQAIFLSQMYEIRLSRTPWPFWSLYLLQLSKNGDEKACF